jgi:hypothetical protein
MTKGNKLFTRILCMSLSVLLLSACSKQAEEEPTDLPPSTEAIESQIDLTDRLDEGELPVIPFPQHTEPVTEITGATEQTEDSTSTEPKPTEPKPTEPPETTPTEIPQPTEPLETVPLETTAPPTLDEDELPPIPIL